VLPWRRLRTAKDEDRVPKMTLVLKTLAFLLIVPGTVAAALPLSLVLCMPNDMPLTLGFWRYAGLLLMVIGAAVYVRCALALAVLGQGIPAPTDPTRFLVRSGIYQRVRNPMYIAGSLFLYGEAIVSALGILFIYAAAVTLFQHLGVVFLEEPALRRRFGESYEQYCRRVPRWLPRFSAVEVSDGAG
jgi:protein-S-isoprenylcysteine O-methyltransferase Ste14